MLNSSYIHPRRPTLQTRTRRVEASGTVVEKLGSRKVKFYLCRRQVGILGRLAFTVQLVGAAPSMLLAAEGLSSPPFSLTHCMQINSISTSKTGGSSSVICPSS